MGECKTLCLKHNSMKQTVEPCVLYTAAQCTNEWALRLTFVLAQPSTFLEVVELNTVTAPRCLHKQCIGRKSTETNLRPWNQLCALSLCLFRGQHRESRIKALISHKSRPILPTFDNLVRRRRTFHKQNQTRHPKEKCRITFNYMNNWYEQHSTMIITFHTTRHGLIRLRSSRRSGFSVYGAVEWAIPPYSWPFPSWRLFQLAWSRLLLAMV